MQALQSQIVTAATSVGARVYRQRRIYVEDIERPCCLIYRGPEAAEFEDLSAPLDRTIEIVTEIHAENVPADMNAPGIEDVLDGLAEEIENAIQADYQVGGSALWIAYQGSEIETEFRDREYGVLRLRWAAMYRTLRTDAGGI